MYEPVGIDTLEPANVESVDKAAVSTDVADIEAVV